MTPFFCALFECPRKRMPFWCPLFRIRQSGFYYIFRLCPWRTMILLSESVASRAERAMNETIFLS